jgi:hypothetical protein
VASPDCSLAKIQSEVGLQGAGRFIHHVQWKHHFNEARPHQGIHLQVPQGKVLSIPVLATWAIRSEKRLFESDLLVLFCLQERSDKGRIRGHAYISCFGLFAKEKPVFPVLIPTKQRLALRFHALYDGIVRGMKPHSTSLLLGTIADLARGKSQLLVENALLRQQLIILHRQVKRPTCKKTDRFLLVLLARMMRAWKQALFIVQPETVLRWHRELFRLFWKHKSKADSRQPRLSPETIVLSRRWQATIDVFRAERIRGELLKRLCCK